MIYVFLGKDFSIVNNSVNNLINDLNISNIIKFDYSESSILDILDEVNYVDLFNEKKLLIVSNFSLKSIKDDDEKKFMRYIENMNDNVIIFKCIDESLDERRSLTKLLKEKCEVKVIEKLDYKELHAYIEKLLKDNNLKASFNQIKKILDLCEYNPDYTINEVNKLLIYKIGETELYDKDIDDVIVKSTEKEMFRLIESVLDKDIVSALDSYNVLISSGVEEVGIVESLGKQYRTLMQLIEHAKGKTDDELARLLGQNKYTIKKLIPFIPKYSEEELADYLHKLSDIDINIKVNSLDKQKLLESFILSI